MGRSAKDLERLAGRLRASVVPLSRQLRRVDGRFSQTQLSVIGTIDRHGPIALGDLAARERLSPPMITRVVGQLEEARFVVREGDMQDRRVTRVHLTPEGKAWVDEGRAQREAWLAERLGQLDDLSLNALERAAEVFERFVDDA